jgi:hypothetical protein
MVGLLELFPDFFLFRVYQRRRPETNPVPAFRPFACRWRGRTSRTGPDNSGGHVGRLYEAKTTPDMRIIDAAGRIVYAGGIDDDPLGKQAMPVNYVAKALDELLAGQPVATPAARAYGCSVKYTPTIH